MQNRLLAISAGIIVNCGGNMILLRLFRLLYAAAGAPRALRIAVNELTWLGLAVAGGFVTARIARDQKLREAGITGLAAMGISIFTTAAASHSITLLNLRWIFLIMPCAVFGGSLTVWAMPRDSGENQSRSDQALGLGRAGPTNGLFAVVAGAVADDMGSKIAFALARPCEILGGWLATRVKARHSGPDRGPRDDAPAGPAPPIATPF